MFKDCLDTIIGLSQTDCSCFDSNKPAGFDTSDTGIFLDELEGLNLNMVNAAADCEKGNIWELMVKARTNAIKSVFTDIMANLFEKSRKQYDTFDGLIGEKEFKGNLTISNDYAGIRIEPKQLRDRLLKLKRIGLIFGTTGTTTLTVYKGYTDATSFESLFTIDLAHTANTVTFTDVPTANQTLQMQEDGIENLFYYLVYPTAGLTVKNNAIDCGCSSDRRERNFAYFQGIKGDDLTNLDGFQTTGDAYGVILDTEMTCDEQDIICRNYAVSDDYKAVLANTVRFKAAATLVEFILSTPNIDRYTMLGSGKRDHWISGKRDHWIKEYNDRVQGYLSDRIDLSLNSCLECYNQSAMRQGRILS